MQRYLFSAILMLLFVQTYSQSVITVGFNNPQFNCYTSEVTFDLVLINESSSIQLIDLVDLCFIIPDSELYDIEMYYLNGSDVDIRLSTLLAGTAGPVFGFSFNPVRLLCAVWEQENTIEVAPFQSIVLAKLKAKSRIHLSNDFLGHIAVLDQQNGNSIVIQGDITTGTVNLPLSYNWISPDNPTNLLVQTNCPCTAYKNINGHPSSDLVNQVSTQINSIDTIGFNEYGHYRAGNNIMLNPGFQVRQDGEFDADIETCPNDCLTQAVCQGATCDFPEYEEDANGNKYVPNQILFSAPSTLVINDDSANIIKDHLDNMFMISTSQSTIVRCLCEKNILLYEVDPSIPINEECCRGSSSGEPFEDGGAVYSVNHYVEADIVHADAFAMPPNPIRIPDTVGSVNVNAVRVAHLDSGVNSAMISEKSLIYSTIASGVICDENGVALVDTIGWNFIDNSAYVEDDRGHGTAVFFSYISGLYQQGITETDQASLVVKVLDECGVGTAFSTACGLYYAAERDVDVINASWGLYTNNPTIQLAMEEISSEVSVVTSAGNQSKNLSGLEHYPSGYAYDYTDAIDPSITKSALNSVFEVANICRGVEEDSCDPNIQEDLWIGSNFRTDDIFFAEPGVKIEEAILEYGVEAIDSECSIVGTSYAAPQFTSGLTYRVLNNLSLAKADIYLEAQKYQPVPNLTYYSLILNNLNCN